MFKSDVGRPLANLFVEENQTVHTIQADSFLITKAQLIEIVELLLSAG